MSDDHRSQLPISRRRFISLFAAAGALSLAPRGLRAGEPKTFFWEGVALGADARLTLQHIDAAVANAAIADCIAEVSRLESIFSLHQADSALSRLNQFGYIDEAPAELRELLAESRLLSRLSDGAFDPTIQPLWKLYADYFASTKATERGPSQASIDAALLLVDWRKILFDDTAIRFGKPDMAITLNGIAQGYITDRVGNLLRERGFEHVLVNMGEGLALGPKWDGSHWTIGISDPREPSAILTELPLVQGAVATSGGYGYQFDRAGRFTHILDPKTGRPSRRWASVTVTADSATLADGISSALMAAGSEMIPAILAGKSRAFFVPFGAEDAAFWV